MEIKEIGAGNETRTRDPDLGKTGGAPVRNEINRLRHGFDGNGIRRHWSIRCYRPDARRRNDGAESLLVRKPAYWLPFVALLVALTGCARPGERLQYSTTLGPQRLCHYETFQTTVDINRDCPPVSGVPSGPQS